MHEPWGTKRPPAAQNDRNWGGFGAGISTARADLFIKCCRAIFRRPLPVAVKTVTAAVTETRLDFSQKVEPTRVVSEKTGGQNISPFRRSFEGGIAKPSGFGVLLASAAQKGWEVHLVDIQNAFHQQLRGLRKNSISAKKPLF